jgi:uncharacterized protein YecT (DUF1311 family)
MLLILLIPLCSQTQAEQNQDACAAYKSDELLNTTYARVTKQYANNGVFLRKLKAAQRAWLFFRDAHLEALCPAADKQVDYGSVYPTCRCAALKELTEQRTRELKTWLDGIPEGAVCRGSVKTAQQYKSAPHAKPNLHSPRVAGFRGSGSPLQYIANSCNTQ